MGKANRINRAGVYSFKHLPSGRVYVGSAVNLQKRWSVHRKSLERSEHNTQRLQADWDRDGAGAFEFSVLEYCERAKLMEREQVWSDALRSYIPEHGYNIRTNVANSRGVKLRAETRARMSAAHLGKKQSPEHAANQCAARRGRKNSEQQRLAIALARRKTGDEAALSVLRMLREGELSQVNIAKSAGVSQRFVSKVKTGKVLWVTALNDSNETTGRTTQAT